ncbi:MAG: PhoH family protein, partial [Bacilli bacterium]
EVILTEPKYEMPEALEKYKNDNRILATAKDLTLFDDNIIFLTDDLNLLLKAENLNIPCDKYKNIKTKHIYSGYSEITMTDEEMAKLYEGGEQNFNLHTNEYLFIADKDDSLVDKFKWNGEKLVSIPNKTFKSIYLDDFKPKDVFQLCAMDSIINNDLTVLYGGAGSGKTLIALSYIMQQISSNKNGKVVIAFNPVKLKNNEQLGFYSGNRVEKLIQNSIGGILESKLGGMTAVELLMSQGKLMIVPTSDIRGIEISRNDILFVTEAQNLDDYTMRTIIQRAEDGCKVIIEGDILEQRDINISLEKSGMYRVIDVFKGEPEFGCVKLENIYRSRLSELAQRI